MGATLPAISRYVEATPEGLSWLGFFYGGNIVGAVVGCLVAGFYLLRVYDLTTAALVAVAINLIVATRLRLLLSKRAPLQATGGGTACPATTHVGAGAVYAAIALSGLTALGAEVVWTRLLSLLFGATTYAFSIILAVFLAGLGIGSAIGSCMRGTRRMPALVLGWAQLLQASPPPGGAFMIAQQIPYWPLNPSLAASHG